MSRSVFSSTLFLLALTIVCFSSCNKVEVEEPPVQGVPVFSVDVQLGNESIALAAGDNGCELSSSVELLNGVQRFTGTLSNANEEVTLKILDGKLDVPISVIQSGLSGNLAYFFNDQSTMAELYREDFPNAEYIEEIKWMVDGVQKGIDHIVFTEPGVYNVCAAITFTDGSHASVCNEMIIGYEKSVFALVRHYVDQQGYIHAWVDSDLVNVTAVKWRVDGVEVCSEEVLVRHLTSQIHTVTAEITFANGAKRIRNVLADGSSEGNFLDDFTIFESIYKSAKKDFNCTLEVKHNGTVFSTEYANNEAASFQITDITYFGLDGNGKKIYTLKAQISCVLSNASGDQLPFEGTVSFGIPGE
jgi:hypothetical protein